MIDLHVHSTFSDGSDDLELIVQKANNLNLDVLSITDHNKCLAFLKENCKPFEKFHGKVITGCEFTARYKNIIVEILAYGFDADLMAQFIAKTYPSFQEDKFRRLKLMMKKLRQLKIVFDKKRLISNVSTGSASGAMLSEILSNEENLGYFNEEIPDKRTFLSDYLNNPDNVFFVDYGVLYPTMREIVSAVKSAGGICLLAHPYEYPLNLEEELDDIIKKSKLDGIECYYPTFTPDQVKFLKDYADSHKLIISGGSDYHGANRVSNQLGTGKEHNLHIEKEHISWLDSIKDFKLLPQCQE